MDLKSRLDKIESTIFRQTEQSGGKGISPDEKLTRATAGVLRFCPILTASDAANAGQRLLELLQQDRKLTR